MDEQIENMTVDAAENDRSYALEKELSVYPLRDPSEDPRWALRTIWTWVGIAVFLLVFIVVLIVLGIWYD